MPQLSLKKILSLIVVIILLVPGSPETLRMSLLRIWSSLESKYMSLLLEVIIKAKALNLAEQGLFALGYYHQTQAFYSGKKDDNSDKQA